MPGYEYHKLTRSSGGATSVQATGGSRTLLGKIRYFFDFKIPFIQFLAMAIIALIGWVLLLNCPRSYGACSQHPSLSDLALQHVLDDAAQIFGPSSFPASEHKSDTATWMSRHPDSTPITQLSIPGAHDAATWNFSQATRDALPPVEGAKDPAYFRTQRVSVAASLEAGVRFFDLRYAMDPTGTTLVFWHRQALLSEIARVSDVMFAFYAWLEGHETETLLLSFQYEGTTWPGAENDARVQQQLYDHLSSPAARKYILQRRDELGTLGNARGKIVLLKRFELDKLPSIHGAMLPGIDLSPGKWPDNQPGFELVYNTDKGLAAYIEDYYEPNDLPEGANASVNIAKKLDVVTAHLRKAAVEKQDSLFITFASAEHVDNEPPVFPETMALGNGTDHTPLGGVNQQLVPVLKELRGQRLGVVVVDFWDEPKGLIRDILGL